MDNKSFWGEGSENLSSLSSISEALTLKKIRVIKNKLTRVKNRIFLQIKIESPEGGIASKHDNKSISLVCTNLSLDFFILFEPK